MILNTRIWWNEKKKTTTTVTTNRNAPTHTNKRITHPGKKEREQEKKDTFKTKFMDCLHSISLTFRSRSLSFWNLGNQWYHSGFHMFQKKRTKTNNQQRTKWHIKTWTIFRHFSYNGCEWLVKKSVLELRLTSVDLSLCPIKCDQIATCCQRCHWWLIHDDKYAVKWRKTSTR